VQKRKRLIFLALTLTLMIAAVLSACLGALHISLPEFYSIIMNRTGLSDEMNYQPQQEAVLLSLRLPRVILGILVGAALAVSGAAMQGLFRNPLADPGLIGVSSGASLFAVLMIVLEVKFFSFISGFLGYYALSIAAFTGAFITAFIVYRLAINQGKTVITTLLLAGIAINALSGAFTGLLTYVATDAELRNITFWGLGSLGGASWVTVTGILPFVLIPVFIMPFLAKSMNAMALGESQAGHMGIPVNRVKVTIIVLVTMAVGACVAVSGIIGFISLVIPHILRMINGPDHRLIIPASALLGAAVLTIADLISRTLLAPAELPIGIITALVGSPIFIYIIFSERKKKYQSS
jgi:iron complex transport system permease protein